MTARFATLLGKPAVAPGGKAFPYFEDEDEEEDEKEDEARLTRSVVDGAG